MSIEKGDIYLANMGDLKKEDIGKIRPVIVFQNNFLNKMIDESLYGDVVVIPLSSKIIKHDFNYMISKRDRLKKDSVAVCNAIKMINYNRLEIQKGVLTKLSLAEQNDIENILYNLFGCTNKNQ